MLYILKMLQRLKCHVFFISYKLLSNFELFHSLPGRVIFINELYLILDLACGFAYWTMFLMCMEMSTTICRRRQTVLTLPCNID